MNEPKKEDAIPEQTINPGGTCAFRPLRAWPAVLLVLLMLAGRFGPDKGQILLYNSGLLLVLSEQGQVVLVAADPAEHRELASFKALEGKTWNHPCWPRIACM